MVKVLAHGCFDLIHQGHIEHLKWAKSQGDYLIVSISSDKSIIKDKGKLAQTEIDRKSILENLEFVDKVVITSKEGYQIIQEINPDIYVKGDEFRDVDIPEYHTRPQGTKILFSPPIKVQSSSAKWFAFNNVELAKMMHSYPEIKVPMQSVRGVIDGETSKPSAITLAGDNILDVYSIVRETFCFQNHNFCTYDIGETIEFDGGILFVKAIFEKLGMNIGDVITNQVPHVKERIIVDDKTIYEKDIIKQKHLKVIANNDELLLVDYSHNTYDTTEGLRRKYFYSKQVRSFEHLNFLRYINQSEIKVFFANELELRIGLNNFISSIESMLAELNCMAVVTMGIQGAIVFDLKEIIRIPSAKMNETKDTTGCGDILMAGTIAAMLDGNELIPSVIFGTVLASRHSGVLGNSLDINYGIYNKIYNVIGADK